MKKIIYVAILTLTLTSCMEARDRTTGMSDSAYSDAYKDDGTSTPITIPDTDDDSDDTTEDSSTTVPTEVSHCSWSTTTTESYAESSNHLGSLNICQSKSDEKNIYIQLKTPVTDTKVCVIPMYESGSMSIYIGNPRCITVPDNEIYLIPLLKNRGTQYANYTITSVMLIKDTKYTYAYPFTRYVANGYYNAVDAFIYCSQALQAGDSSFCTAFTAENEHFYKSFL